MFVPPFITTAPPALTIQTTNWVGYSWPNSTKAVAQWKVPAFPWKTPLSNSEAQNHNALTMWAGLGTKTIAQTGIYDYVTNGHVGWYGLYEFYPYPPVQWGGAISPGDTIIARVTRSGINYTLRLQDNGPKHRWAVQITKAFGHKETTAEFIVEDAEYFPNTYQPLTGFSPVTANVSGHPTTRWAAPWGHATAGAHSVRVTG